jgi:hypothetical protein
MICVIFAIEVLPRRPDGTYSPVRLLECNSPGNVEANDDGNGPVQEKLYRLG